MRLFTLALLTAGISIAQTPTFSKDVAPILQKHCQECHRAGEIGPMPLLSYTDARPWAKSIKEAVVSRRMPPWSADPHYGQFSNDRSLTQAEINTLVAWADGGAQQGNPKDAPAPREFTEGWQIGKPDLVLDTGVDCSRARHHPVHAFRGAHRFHRGQVDPGNRSPSGEQGCGPSRGALRAP